MVLYLQNKCLLSNHTALTSYCLDESHFLFVCGFVEDPLEVESVDSDRLQSDGQSSPLDCRSFKKGDGDPKSPSPADANPAMPPATPTQPYYVNGEPPQTI